MPSMAHAIQKLPVILTTLPDPGSEPKGNTLPLLGSMSAVASARASAQEEDMGKEACFLARPSGRAKTGADTNLEPALNLVWSAERSREVCGDTVEQDTWREESWLVARVSTRPWSTHTLFRTLSLGSMEMIVGQEEAREVTEGAAVSCSWLDAKAAVACGSRFGGGWVGGVGRVRDQSEKRPRGRVVSELAR
jgi:hypothetical protein